MANHFRDGEFEGMDELEPQDTPTAAPQTDQGADTDALVDLLMSELTTEAAEAPESEEPVAPTPEPADEGAEVVAFEPAAPVEATPVAETSPTPDPISVPDPLAAPIELPDPAVDPAEPAPAISAVAVQGTYATAIPEPAPEVNRTGTPAISMRNVTLVYPAQPNKPALDDISLDIYPGEFVFLVGHSGSGKSTFIRLLNRELRATKGEVIVGGMDLTKMRNRKVPFLRRQIGCVFQDFKLLPDKTCYENVAFALECIGKPKSVIDVQVPEVLRLVGLADRMDSYPDQLSGGEQQRVSVARAMVNRPPLLICDEPTGNLDPAISLGIMKLLDRINRTGTTVVMATHDREMVDSMRRRVIALEAGHLVRDQERGGYGNYGIL